MGQGKGIGRCGPTAGVPGQGGCASLRGRDCSKDLQLVREGRTGVWGHAKAQRQKGAGAFRGSKEISVAGVERESEVGVEGGQQSGGAKPGGSETAVGF